MNNFVRWSSPFTSRGPLYVVHQSWLCELIANNYCDQEKLVSSILLQDSYAQVVQKPTW